MLDIELYAGLMQLAQNTKTVIGQLPLGYYPVTRLSFPLNNQNSGNGRVLSSDFQIEISVYGEISIISAFTDIDFLHIHYTYIAA